MTKIDFYSGGGDRLNTACRLVAKVVRQGLKLMIYTPDAAMAGQLDKLLWTFSSIDFIPHCHTEDKLSGITPVVIGRQPPKLPHDDVLLNLDVEYPPFFSRFQRLIEITGSTAEDTRAARKRYRYYQDRGYEIRHHKLGMV
ncbi:MAG: DNA polymerase III subunit chi [Pseudomonadota bacterium]|nr:DNA polymerase III subunit chi [Pseudomonadota bacterium]